MNDNMEIYAINEFGEYESITSIQSRRWLERYHKRNEWWRNMIAKALTENERQELKMLQKIEGNCMY